MLQLKAYLEYKRWFGPDQSSVGLQQRGKANGQLGYAVCRSLTEILGLVAPRQKYFVIVNVCYHTEHLLRRISEE